MYPFSKRRKLWAGLVTALFVPSSQIYICVCCLEICFCISQNFCPPWLRRLILLSRKFFFFGTLTARCKSFLLVWNAIGQIERFFVRWICVFALLKASYKEEKRTRVWVFGSTCLCTCPSPQLVFDLSNSCLFDILFRWICVLIIHSSLHWCFWVFQLG